MREPAHELAIKTRNVISLQAGIGALVTAGFFMLGGSWGAFSAGYGGMVSVISTYLLSRGVARAGKDAEEGTRRGEVILYLSAAARFILVLSLLGFGLAALELAPLATVAGFVAVQLSFLLAARGRRPAAQ